VILFLFLFNCDQIFAQGHFRVRNDAFVQIGYSGYKVLSFGQETNSPNNGKFALEYWSDLQGLNFWKPWPTQNPSNFNLFLRDDGNAAIGSSGDSNFKLDVAGNCRCGSWVSNSDKRFKRNIQPLGNALSTVLLLKPVTYDLNYQLPKYGSDSKGLTDEKTKTMENDGLVKVASNARIGLVAQDVESVLPQIVTKDDKGFLSVNYVDLIPVLVEAIKEQQKEIDALKKFIAELKR
jgi:hypothetical protein